MKLNSNWNFQEVKKSGGLFGLLYYQVNKEIFFRRSWIFLRSHELVKTFVRKKQPRNFWQLLIIAKNFAKITFWEWPKTKETKLDKVYWSKKKTQKLLCLMMIINSWRINHLVLWDCPQPWIKYWNVPRFKLQFGHDASWRRFFWPRKRKVSNISIWSGKTGC